MRSIALGNEKGGVGKSSSCLALASGLAHRGKKVLLIDTSAQGNCAAAFDMKKEPCIYDLLCRNGSWKDLLRLVPPEKYLSPGMVLGQHQGALYLLPSNHETRAIPSNVSDGFALLKRILQLKDAFEYVIIDTPPEPGLMHVLVYAAAFEYIYVTKPEQWSIDGIDDSFAHLNEFNPMRESRGLSPVKVLGILPTMYLRTVEHDENLLALEESYKNLVMRKIWTRIAWTEATSAKCSIFNWAPDSQAAAEAWELVDRVEGAV